MDWEHLNWLIVEFESQLRDATSLFSLPTSDWRPFFAKAKEIQDGFSSRVMYPARQQREEAWIRFNDLRSKLHEHANKYRRELREESERLRDEIMASIKWAGYSWAADALLFFVPTTVEDMKMKGRTLKEAGQALSNNKHRMLKEHKDECFARILELRQTHEDFWGKYKEHLAQRHAEVLQRRSEIADRVQSNIRENSERLDKAIAAYERVQENLNSNMEKLESAHSPGFAARVSGWIAEDREKLGSISESIERLREWVEEGQRRLDDIHNHKP